MTEVVAALIWDKHKIMICQRPANKAHPLPLLWTKNMGSCVIIQDYSNLKALTGST